MKIVLIGCGFVGSWLATFLVRHLRAHQTDIPVVLVDFDVVDPHRNVVNQAFTTGGKAKAVALQEQLEPLYKYITSVTTRVTEQNLKKVLRNARVVVDATDNVETRRLLAQSGKPTLHVGISPTGTAVCEWQANFTIADGPTVETLPPCELVSYLPLGVLVAALGAEYIMRYIFDDKKTSVNIAEAMWRKAEEQCGEQS